MLTLPHRHRLPEIMDQPDLRPARHVGALNGLARFNWWSGSAGILWRPLRDLARRLGRPMRVLDAASGGGDVPLRLGAAPAGPASISASTAAIAAPWPWITPAIGPPPPARTSGFSSRMC